MILGSHFYCPYTDCEHLEKECASSQTIWSMDKACPCYANKEDMDYYRLSNSDEIEVESYLEGFPYPSFDAFTHLMTDKRDHLSESDKRDFWNRVAFTNYIQHYWPDGHTPPYTGNESLFDNDYDALKAVLADLNPQIIIVWHEAIKDCLLAHDELTFMGMIDMPVISTYLFTYPGAAQKLSKTQLKLLAEKYNLISETVTTEWLKDLLKKSFNNPHAVESFGVKTIFVDNDTEIRQPKQKGKKIKDIAALLKQCATQKLIIRMGNRLSFGPGMSGLHKETFFKLIKEHFEIPPMTTQIFSKMFDYNFGHYYITSQTEDAKTKLMKSIFDKVYMKKEQRKQNGSNQSAQGDMTL